jgi:hypothetical protein
MCVNDIIVQGAKPLFFLDYLSIGKLETEIEAGIIQQLNAMKTPEFKKNLLTALRLSSEPDYIKPTDDNAAPIGLSTGGKMSGAYQSDIRARLQDLFDLLEKDLTWSTDRDTDKKESSQPDVPTRVYATLPIKYIYGGRTFDGTAVKLRVEGVRIDTTAEMPDVYSPLEIEIPVSIPGKEGVLRLNGTVSLVKKAKKAKGGQFEVKFSLKNSPAVLEGYRGILRMLQESIAQS